MKKLISFFAVIVVALQCGATTYYFSTTGGDDLRSAATAQNPLTPWKTIDTLNSKWRTGVFHAGDNILLNRGETFRTTTGIVVLHNGGTGAGSRIIVGTYGSGADPIITGLTNLTFTALGGGRYASQSLPIAGINLVAQNGIPQRIARYPNITAAASGYLTYTATSYNSSTFIGTITKSSGTIGAPAYLDNTSNIVMKEDNWAINKSTVTGHTSTTVTFQHDNNGVYKPKTGFGFFLQNDSAFLDENGEWWQSNTSTNRIIYFSNTGSAPTGVVAATTTTLVTCAAFSYITFDNIDFEGCNGYMVNLTSSSGSSLSFTNCEMNLSGETIMHIGSGNATAGPTNTIIDNCQITNSMNCGIFDNGQNTTITNTDLYNIGKIAGMAANEVNFASCGIEVKNDVSMISNVTIRNTGGTGISTRRSSDNDTIQYCRIDSFGLLKKDLGGIYYFGKGNGTTNNTGRYCVYNTVGDGVGNIDGTTDANKDAYALYLDMQSTGVTAKHNLFYNSSRGILVNSGCMFLTLDSNTCYNNSVQQIYFSTGTNARLGGSSPDSMYQSLHVQWNVLYSTLASQAVAQAIAYPSATAWNLSTIGSGVDNNYFFSPLSADGLIVDTIPFGGGANILLSAYNNLPRVNDVHSIESPYHYANSTERNDSTIVIINYSASDSTVTFASNRYSDAYGTSYSSSAVVPAYSTLILFWVAAVAAPSTELKIILRRGRRLVPSP